MDQAWIGLIGVAIGSVSSFGAQAFTQWRTDRAADTRQQAEDDRLRGRERALKVEQAFSDALDATARLQAHIDRSETQPVAEALPAETVHGFVSAVNRLRLYDASTELRAEHLRTHVQNYIADFATMSAVELSAAVGEFSESIATAYRDRHAP